MGVFHPKKKADANKRLKFSVHRVKIFLWSKNAKDPIACFAFLVDIKKDSVAVYLDRKLNLDAAILVAFKSKGSQTYHGKVIWNRSIDYSNTSGRKGFAWRAGMRFEFASKDESRCYAQFRQEIIDKIDRATSKDKEQPVTKESNPKKAA